MTAKREYTGDIFCSFINWTLIYEKEVSEIVTLTFSGVWRPNKHWGDVDYRGKPNTSAPPSYRGPGKPEGCMLLKIGDGSAQSIPNFPFVLTSDIVGNIFLACNDDPNGLNDNMGKIAFTLSSDLL